MENWDDEPFSKGKILDIKGDIEKYRLDEENLTLIPIKNSTSGLLKKEGLTEYEFEKFIPGDCPAGGGRAFYLESELLIPHRPSPYVVKNDSILSQTFELGKTSRKELYDNLHGCYSFSGITKKEFNII